MADLKRRLERILDDESLTDGLADAEAKIIVDWALARAREGLAKPSGDANALVDRVRQQARWASRIVSALCHDQDVSAAQELWQERHPNAPLPDGPTDDPCAVARRLLEKEVTDA